MHGVQTKDGEQKKDFFFGTAVKFLVRIYIWFIRCNGVQRADL